MISLTTYIFISIALFVCGVVTMMARKNIIAILLGVELILNSAAINFVAFSKFLNHGNNAIDGQVMTLFIIVIAAAEAAVGLAIVIRFFQIRESVHIDDATQLQS